jgi:hypothetical protein
VLTADAIAGYAAFVGTAALALEVRRWVESGPKLSLGVSPNMVSADASEKRWVMVTVSNRGDQATTLTHLGVVGFPNTLARLRDRPDPSYIVPRPEGQTLPHVIDPGGRWVGLFGDEELFAWIDGGGAYVQISAIHRDRPFYRRVPKPRPAAQAGPDPAS